jgi:Zn finger protein HypA/HybF involved in hydrogenase expression
MDNITKKLKCKKCGKVDATNKLNDNRFYCPKCGINLGCYVI